MCNRRDIEFVREEKTLEFGGNIETFRIGLKTWGRLVTDKIRD